MSIIKKLSKQYLEETFAYVYYLEEYWYGTPLIQSLLLTYFTLQIP